MCLKPPVLLWLAVLYLSRALTLPIAMAIAHFAGLDSNVITALRGAWSLDSIFPSLIAAAILYALFRRVPGAHPLVRWIWARGRIFLAASAVIDIALQLNSLIRQNGISDASLWWAAATTVDVYFLVYLLGARRVRDTFAEFPAPLDPPARV